MENPVTQTLQITELGEFILDYCSRLDQLPKNVFYKRVMKKTENEQKKEAIKELFKQEDIQRMWMKMHTPWTLRGKKVRRNETCPFCDSGLKYKQCECYEKRFNGKYVLDEKHTKGWR